MNARLGTRFAPIKAVSRPRDAIHPKTIHQTHGDTMKNHFTPFASDANAKTVSASLSHPSTARNLLKSPVRGIVRITVWMEFTSELTIRLLDGCRICFLVYTQRFIEVLRQARVRSFLQDYNGNLLSGSFANPYLGFPKAAPKEVARSGSPKPLISEQNLRFWSDTSPISCQPARSCRNGRNPPDL